MPAYYTKYAFSSYSFSFSTKVTTFRNKFELLLAAVTSLL